MNESSWAGYFAAKNSKNPSTVGGAAVSDSVRSSVTCASLGHHRHFKQHGYAAADHAPTIPVVEQRQEQTDRQGITHNRSIQIVPAASLLFREALIWSNSRSAYSGPPVIVRTPRPWHSVTSGQSSAGFAEAGKQRSQTANGNGLRSERPPPWLLPVNRRYAAAMRQRYHDQVTDRRRGNVPHNDRQLVHQPQASPPRWRRERCGNRPAAADPSPHAPRHTPGT